MIGMRIAACQLASRQRFDHALANEPVSAAVALDDKRMKAAAVPIAGGRACRAGAQRAARPQTTCLIGHGGGEENRIRRIQNGLRQGQMQQGVGGERKAVRRTLDAGHLAKGGIIGEGEASSGP